MTRLAFSVDAELCVGCNTCAMACKNQNNLDPGISWRKVYPLSEHIYPHRERAFFSLACNHCENPACLRGCPVGAYTKRPDGIVVHNQNTCIGCRACVLNCPFGVPQYNPNKGNVEKCSMCNERIDAGLLPACIQACPTSALTLVDLDAGGTAGTLSTPPGFPNRPDVGPGTRFKMPTAPVVVRRKV